MHAPNRTHAWLVTLILALPACGPETTEDATETSAQASATCSGYVALTFDDGPGWNTSTLISALKSAGAKATFMNVGKNVAAYPSLIASEAAQGWVGNHSYNHNYMTSYTYTQDYNELYNTDCLIYNQIKVWPSVFRPPYGAYNSTLSSAASALYARLVTWDIDTQDWNGASTATIVSRASAATAGQIVLMHDGYTTTNAAIPTIVKNLAAKGLCPGKISYSTGRAVAP